MLNPMQDLIRRGWTAFRFRRHWPWVMLAIGLLLSLPPVDSGCATALAWVGGLVLLARVLRWIWDKLLFRVSRRLWVILALMSVLPVVAMALMLISLSWLGLGAQVNRSTQQTLAAWEDALKIANQEPSDAPALQALRTYGNARVDHVRRLPEGAADDFIGMVWADALDGGLKGTQKNTAYLRAVCKEPGGFRILSLNASILGDRIQAMAGGPVRFQLVPRKQGSDREGRITIRTGDPGKDKEAPILEGRGDTIGAWTVGQSLQGRFLFAPFNLPPLAFAITDWSTGHALVLTATPETNLYALFAGFQSRDQQGLSSGTVKAIIVVALVLGGLIVAQAVATLLGLVLAWSLGRAVNDLHGGVKRLSLGDFPRASACGAGIRWRSSPWLSTRWPRASRPRLPSGRSACGWRRNCGWQGRCRCGCCRTSRPSICPRSARRSFRPGRSPEIITMSSP